MVSIFLFKAAVHSDEQHMEVLIILWLYPLKDIQAQIANEIQLSDPISC